jgi:formate dehydrogenase (coenzyme F420) beta subunit
MNNMWSFETHGDPLASVRQLIRAIWLQAGLSGMLVTMDAGSELNAVPRYITDPADVFEINPFRPLMEMNIARLIPEVLAIHPDQHIAAILRPCEMRALIEMAKHTSIDTTNLLTISFDCLGTLPADEYQWRLERIEKKRTASVVDLMDTGDELAGEALQFARQGGIIPYRYRSACQVCISPAAEQADININVLGLPVRQLVLITIARPEIADSISLDSLAARDTDEHLFTEHERIVATMCERHARTMERINQAVGDQLPANVDALISQLESCGDCQSCLDVCPICSVDRPSRDSGGHYERTSVMRWLVSCAGCGMCEQACPDRLPVASLFAHIRQQLDQEWQYLPGRSSNDRLPDL